MFIMRVVYLGHLTLLLHLL